jgi:tetratricopeptide (TPR) repeat protein
LPTRRANSTEPRNVRQALEQEPAAFDPLVNLGGVLVTVHKLDQAVDYNLRAVLARPNDALANSQLGLTYFELARMDLAQKYLERTRQIDPRHFSRPQLLLAEIHLRRGERREAAAVLEEFLKLSPRLAAGRQDAANHRRIAAIMELLASPHRPPHSRSQDPPQ